MKHLPILTALLLTPLAGLPAAAPPPARPNIVLIMADDQVSFKVYLGCDP